MEVVNSHSGGSFLILTMTVQLILCWNGVYTTDSTKRCTLLSNSPSEQKVLRRLEPLANKNFTVETKDGNDSYTYVFQLCGDAAGIPGAGVVQFDKNNPKSKAKMIGTYNATQAVGGSDWAMLIYKNGDKYDHHCSSENRKAYIMISCNRKVDLGPLEVVVEYSDGGHECLYLFEMDSSAVCPPLQSQLSTGSIILIIGFCLLAVYLIGGFLYQRLIVGAKGMEQFPNYAFWIEMGNLTADGCNFMCRSGNPEEAPAYRGVVAEPLEDDPEDRDDHLLPM